MEGGIMEYLTNPIIHSKHRRQRFQKLDHLLLKISYLTEKIYGCAPQ